MHEPIVREFIRSEPEIRSRARRLRIRTRDKRAYSVYGAWRVDADREDIKAVLWAAVLGALIVAAVFIIATNP